MFNRPAIIGDDVAQTNNEILHDPLKCRNIDAVDDPVKGDFQLWNGLWLLLYKVSLI